MQVKKFEAETIQEALETIKRELGPEAIILQTKKNKRGFGLMSKASVEVTAAISDRSVQKKQYVETRLPDETRETLRRATAEKQAKVYNKVADSHLDAGLRGAQDNVQLRAQAKRASDPQAAASGKRITATRYIDIDGRSSEAMDMARASQAAASVRAQAQAQGQIQAQAQLAHQAQQALLDSQAQSQGQSQAQSQDLTHAQAQAQAQGRARAASSSTTQAPLNAQSMPIEEEVRHLKRMLQEMRVAQEEGLLGSGAQSLLPSGTLGTPALQDAFEQMVINGVDKRFCLTLLKKVGFELGPESSRSPDAVLDQLAIEIMSTTQVLSPLAGIRPKNMAGEVSMSAGPGPVIIALVGPTGVGKTTTVAKMASDGILRRGLKVGLINVDSYKVAAFDQLATYAKILNVPFRSAGSVEDLKVAVQDFHNLDLILIDTTGRSQRDPGSLKEMETMLSCIPTVQAHLVLSVTTRDSELYDMATRFSIFKPQGIIMSKLDEATTFGPIYNVPQRIKLPLIYFTTGQRVPEDIEEATRERVAALIMDL